MYHLKNICMKGNEHGLDTPNVIYAKLVDDNGVLLMSAPLDRILKVIRDRRYEVDNVQVHYRKMRGVDCSTVHILTADPKYFVLNPFESHNPVNEGME